MSSLADMAEAMAESYGMGAGEVVLTEMELGLAWAETVEIDDI